MAKLKYEKNWQITVEDILTLRYKFWELIPFRIKFFECEREILENMRKIWDILLAKEN